RTRRYSLVPEPPQQEGKQALERVAVARFRTAVACRGRAPAPWRQLELTVTMEACWARAVSAVPDHRSRPARTPGAARRVPRCRGGADPRRQLLRHSLDRPPSR